ncbi:hypothetical protein SLI_1401 [Streptomyces lividans 1326]|uniref:Uncharacterized protein n=1 Tax=Streptomyces lividans 1326 TaxID=1200984 RepID=A0A7U9DS85_STRLI|nr:hypothetical protein SLI_1401 [Streptomyces lividans 1326]
MRERREHGGGARRESEGKRGGSARPFSRTHTGHPPGARTGTRRRRRAARRVPHQGPRPR